MNGKQATKMPQWKQDHSQESLPSSIAALVTFPHCNRVRRSDWPSDSHCRTVSGRQIFISALRNSVSGQQSLQVFFRVCQSIADCLFCRVRSVEFHSLSVGRDIVPIVNGVSVPVRIIKESEAVSESEFLRFPQNELIEVGILADV